jgi:hypothetical protein
MGLKYGACEAAFGDLGERFKPAVLKTADSQGSVSSNLTVSAKIDPQFASIAGFLWPLQPTNLLRTVCILAAPRLHPP